MTQQTIERNKEIATMLGWKEATLEYKLKWCGIPTEERLNKIKPKYVPILMKENEEPLFESSIWHLDWNWLMEGVNFIKQNIKVSDDGYTKEAIIGEFFIDKWEFSVKKYYLRIIQWTENGWRMFNGVNENPDLSMYYIIGKNCISEKEAVFLIVSDFAKLYNEGKL
jgi:hypothetical protein